MGWWRSLTRARKANGGATLLMITHLTLRGFPVRNRLEDGDARRAFCRRGVTRQYSPDRNNPR
jgi:hypothetical protein